MPTIIRSRPLLFQIAGLPFIYRAILYAALAGSW